MPLGRKHLRRSRDAPTGGFWPSKNYFYFRLETDGSQPTETRRVAIPQLGEQVTGESSRCPISYGVHGCTGLPFKTVIGAEVIDFVGSVTEVAVSVTVLPVGT
jgi:hypothetical protein